MKPEHFVSICRYLACNPNATQRELSAGTKLSLGLVNSILKECLDIGYLKQIQGNRRCHKLTKAGQAELDKFKVKNAIILAAGFGSRFVPLTYEIPKGLLEVHGQPMIERQIEQLIERGITEIIIVVGYKKENFDYLTDKYGVRLVYNPEYAKKNNLSSLYSAKEWLDCSYILMSDFWIEENIFNRFESQSWYSCIYNQGATSEWCIKTAASNKIESIKIGGHDSWVLIGPAYLNPELSAKMRGYLTDYFLRPEAADFYWEQILIDHIKTMPIYLNEQTGNVHEFENLEELRLFDHSYNENSKNDIMKTIANAFGVAEDRIQNIKPMKLGMTNHSFTFTHDGVKYIMRIPGEGTDMIINRANEYAVYQVVSPLNISDDVILIDPATGYKITKFYEDSRVCDPFNITDVKVCMKKLRQFHNMKLSTDHIFDIFERIEYYESLWLTPDSHFRDYSETKANIMSLKKYIDDVPKDRVLTHIDAVADNFLFVRSDCKHIDGGRIGNDPEIRLIDWEYSGMQDPLVDIAMFAVYSMYNRRQVDELIDCYFTEGSSNAARFKIYAYIAICGLLWSNWCEYKSHMGVEFGEYSLRQYRFAKDYFRIFIEKER